MGNHLRLPVALVVDDEPQILRLIVRCLEAEGFQVLSAHSRTEAEQLAESADTVDALVTDIFLGDGWGGELAFHLKEQYPNLAVVFVSGMVGNDPVLRHGIQDHMVFVEKPFTMVQLAEALGEAMEKAPEGTSDSP